MKLALVATLAVSASAFAPQANNARPSVAMQAENSRREAMTSIAGAAAALIPVAANAAAGESPRFSVFGVIGDGGSYSEGAAYGSDQSAKVYSPYSVYGEVGTSDALYKAGNDSEVARKKAYIAESQKRLANLPGYVEKKQWFNVKDELTRYMYETRGAVRGLAKTPEQKKLAKKFFEAIEEATLQATLKNQDACAAASADSVSLLQEFSASL
jgi:photosystem II oxygen-evolving enhancer protein 3